MSRINYRIFLASVISFVFFFSFFQTSQAGFFDWFRKNNSQSTQSAAAVASSAKQYILSISKSGSGVVTSDDGKINCGKQCKASFSANSKIVLKAEAGNNYKFERWNGCDKVLDGKCQTTLNKSKMIVAKFVSKKASSSSFSQKSFSLSSGKTSSSKFFDFSSKSNNFKFSSSSKNSSLVSNKQTQNHKTLIIKTVFNKGSGVIKIGDKVCRISECVFEYNLNENLMLQADPDHDSVIDDWGYDCDYVFVPNKTCGLIMNDNKIVVVYFGQNISGASSLSSLSSSASSKSFSSSKSSFSVSSKQTQNYKTLTIRNASYNKGKGVIKVGDKTCNVSQCVFEYDLNKSLELRAEPESGSVLSDWGYDCDYVFAPNNTCSLIMDDDKTVIVYFGPGISFSSKSSSLSSSAISKSSSSSSSVASKSSSSVSESSALLEEIGNESDWKLMGPSDGRVNTVVILSSNELLIGTKSGGVFRSVNSRSSWKSSSDGLGSKKIYFLNKIKDKIFAATGDGLYLFNESGYSWQKVYQYGVPFKEFFTVKEDIDGNMWALSEDGLFFSKDGYSWEKNNSISIEKATTVVVGTSDLLLASKKGDIYVITKSGLHQSKDSGVTWKNIFAEAGSIAEDEKGAIYVISSEKLYKKDYNQDSFEKLDYSFNPKSGVVYYSDGVLYIEEFSDLLFSNNYGKTFEKICGMETDCRDSSFTGTSPRAFWDIRQMLSDGRNKIILANDNGISEVDINNKNFKKYSEIYGYSEVTSFSLAKSGEKFTMPVAYWDHSSAFSFAGNEWILDRFGGEFDHHSLDPQGSNLIVICASQELTINIVEKNGVKQLKDLSNDYYCAGSNNNSVVFDDRENPSKAYITVVKKNNGKVALISFKATPDSANFNLEERDISDTYAGSIAIDPSNKSRLVVLGDNKLYETLDGGKTWNLFADLRGRTGFIISINPFNSKEAMLSGLFGNIIKINNGNVSDLKLPYDMSKVTDNFVYSVAYDDKKQNVLYAASQQGLFYSLDDGENWKKFNKGLYSKDIRVVIPMDDKVFIGVWGSGIASIKKDILLKSNENN